MTTYLPCRQMRQVYELICLSNRSVVLGFGFDKLNVFVSWNFFFFGGGGGCSFKTLTSYHLKRKGEKSCSWIPCLYVKVTNTQRGDVTL